MRLRKAVETAMRGNRAQALVVAALAMTFLVGMVGLIIDGGAVYAHQRMAQNGADGAANAGAVVLAQWVTDQGGPLQDTAVELAVNEIAASNNLADVVARYTTNTGADISGTDVGQRADGQIPASARGVRVLGARELDTTFSRLLGINSLRASADAIAVVGKLAGCPLDSPCGLLPVAFPVSVSTCQAPHETWYPPVNPFGGAGNEWPLVAPEDAIMPSGAGTMATIALCTNDSGAVGWLDLTDIPTVAGEISTPYTGPLDVPDWYQTKAGNLNNVESALDEYNGKVVLIPMWDSICRDYPGSPTAACPPVTRPADEPGGNNIWYHIPQFTAFKLYDSHVQGNDVGPCASDPGTPRLTTSAGFAGCIKGWFTQFISQGPISFDPNVIPGEAVGIQLIK